jgi:hypothetical protein
MPGVFLYSAAQPANSSVHFFLTSGSDSPAVPQKRRRSSRASSAKVRWKRGPAFWMRPSRMVRARSWRCRFPYLSFFLMARDASEGPVSWRLTTSTRSGMPLKSSTGIASLVNLSIVTVTAEYGFFCKTH